MDLGSFGKKGRVVCDFRLWGLELVLGFGREKGS